MTPDSASSDYDPTQLADPSIPPTVYGTTKDRQSFSPAETATPGDIPGGEYPPRQPAAAVGRFVIGPFHARGGLGEVYHATDTELNRAVAVKFIRDLHANHPASRQRFLAEAEITARLDHPGVVPVYGLVADENGLLCYAMRFIRGDSLKDAIDRFHASTDSPTSAERRLAFRLLVQRFVAVCQTIAYAHNRGVLHRDIKPQNVMVGAFGETLVVDWGLAKVIGRPPVHAEAESAEDTIRPSLDSDPSTETRMGTAVGTPGYMSPEQAAGRWDVVDQRTDVYGLGATFYHLLTGNRPFAGDDPFAVMQRVQWGDFPHPRQVKPDVPRSLEAVCLKAMALKPEDRYPTPLALAADLERWLSDEPVSCYREPLSARAGRAIRRRPASVAAVVTLLAVGAVAFAAGFALVSAERNATEAAWRAEERQRQLAQDRLAEVEQAQAAADAERAAALAVNAFLTDDLLGQVDVANQDGSSRRDPNITVRELLDRSAARIGDTLQDRPLSEAAIRLAIGKAYLALAKYNPALTHLERSRSLYAKHRGTDHPDYLTVQDRVATVYQEQGKYAEAEPLFRQVLATRTAQLGSDNAETLTSMNNLAILYRLQGRYTEAEQLLQTVAEARAAHLAADDAEMLTTRNNLAAIYQDQGKYAAAEQIYRETISAQTARLGADHPDTLSTRHNLANLLARAGNFAEAEDHITAVTEAWAKYFGPDHPATLSTRNILARIYHQQQRYADSERLYQEIIAAQTARLGADHPDTLASRNNLALVYKFQGRYDEAARLCETVLADSTPRLGADHPAILTTQDNLAGIYEFQGKLADAEALYQAVLQARTSQLGPHHPDTLTTQNNLAVIYGNQGRYEEAEQLNRMVIDLRTKHIGAGHPDTLATQNNLANVYRNQERYDEAEALYRAMLAASSERFGPDNRLTLVIKNNLGDLYRILGRLEEAEPLFREVLDTRLARLGPDNPDTVLSQGNLAALYAALGRYAEAEPLFRAAVAGHRRIDGAESPPSITMLVESGINLLRLRKYADAEELLRECWTIRRAKQPDAWTTFNTESLLGEALLGQQKYAEAEPLLLSGYAGIKARVEAIPPRFRRLRLEQALNRLIDLYTAWERPEEAAKWTAERTDLPREVAPRPRTHSR
jgi:tetratricopeptide (TPR) repeat protein/tRNA A-37 threonylcarbamoyl transferase component Bud32